MERLVASVKFPQKLTILVLGLYLLSFFFPFFSVRENRISAEITFSSMTLPLLYLLLLVIPPLCITLYGSMKRLNSSKLLLSITGTLGLLIPYFVLISVGPEATLQLGQFSRFSPASGLYIYIVATLVIFLMKGKLDYKDYIGIILVVIAIFLSNYLGSIDRLGIILESRNLGSRLYRETVAHLRITGISIGISVALGIPLALISYQNMHIRKILFPFLNILQTIPGIALFGLLIAPLAAISQAFPLLRQWGIKGIGNTPAIMALSIYALYPIIRYSFTAFAGIDSSVILAAKGMGMTSRQIWRIVRFPLSAPSVLHGIRVALVQTIGNATLAKLIGGDGLGVLVFEGLGQASVDMVLLGMFLIIALTLASDRLFQVVIYLITPKALRNRGTVNG